MERDPFFKVELIAFGTHLSHFHGYTLDHITEEGFETPYQIESLVLGDTQEAMSTSMGLTSIKFSSFWQAHHKRFDLVFCLGDRYEMFAAVYAAVPFGTYFAHFHGGETTLGAVDNIFRHAISLASKLHFVSTNIYSDRLKSILGESKNIYVTGALSLDNLNTVELLSKEEFANKWKINLNKPTVLVTLHPETVAIEMNEAYAATIANVINQLLKYQVVVTMPNSDAAGSVIRRAWERLLEKSERIVIIENFGTEGYLSCMKHCSFLLGNTSSGIIEAASLNKYVINVGDRQKGRVRGANVFDCTFSVSDILAKITLIEGLPAYAGDNIYWCGGAVDKIIEIIKDHRL